MSACNNNEFVESAHDNAAYFSYIERFKSCHPDIARNREEIKQRIAAFDKQIMAIVKKFPEPGNFQKFAGQFFAHRNFLAQYIGDPLKKEENYGR